MRRRKQAAYNASSDGEDQDYARPGEEPFEKIGTRCVGVIAGRAWSSGLLQFPDSLDQAGNVFQRQVEEAAFEPNFLFFPQSAGILKRR